MKLSSLSLLPAIAAAISTAVLDAAPSKAILYIDFIPIASGGTRIQASGSLDRLKLGANSGTSNFGLNPNPTSPSTSQIEIGDSDLLRFSYNNPAIASASNQGQLFVLTGGAGTNPFTGPTLTGPTFWQPPAPSNGYGFGLRFAPNAGNTQFRMTLPDAYISTTPINDFFNVNLSLAQIGLASPTITYSIGTEQVIFRQASVPGPLPLFGAAAAFGCSRKLRKRIRNTKPESHTRPA